MQQFFISGVHSPANRLTIQSIKFLLCADFWGGYAGDPEKLKEVQDLVGANKERIINAPVLICSTFERGKSGFFQGQQTNEVGEGWGAYDNGLSNCYLILKARAMNFDTLIMGMRDADGLRKAFNIPENETIMAVIALEYRAGDPDRPKRRPLNEIVRFY